MDLESFISPVTANRLMVQEGALVAEGERFEIQGDIPRFVGSDNCAEAFGLQWNTFKRTQLDSYTGEPVTERRLEAAFGQPLAELDGKRVLEAGSGADTHDRNTDHFKRHVTRRGFQAMLRTLGYVDSHVALGGTGYVARAAKPS